MSVWTYDTVDQSPGAVALVFGASQFDPPRELARAWGFWAAPGVYAGGFELRGDSQIYRIDGNGSRWTVSTKEASE